MTAHPRIEELRRRVHQDPASIAFAQLAEELRRAGEYEEAVRVCRAGLTRHPAYLSARVTLGRALVALDQLDEAEAEFEYVLRAAPENLTALRELSDVRQRASERAPAPVTIQSPAVRNEAPIASEPVDPIAREDGGLSEFRAEDDRFNVASTAGATGILQETAPAVHERETTGPEESLQQLEQWLDAILADRATRERDARDGQSTSPPR